MAYKTRFARLPKKLYDLDFRKELARIYANIMADPEFHMHYTWELKYLASIDELSVLRKMGLMSD